jgi:hypothetical protein
MPLPDPFEPKENGVDTKYNFISSYKSKELKNEYLESLKPLGYKTKARYNDECIDDEELSKEGFYKLFGLKHVDFLSKEEAQEFKARAMFEQDLPEILKPGQEIDELTKEILFLDYLLYQFSIPENNARKEKLICKMREEDHSYSSYTKLQEYDSFFN